MHMNPLTRTRMSRKGWSLFRRPVKSRDFPARLERLITADEMVRFGI